MKRHSEDDDEIIHSNEYILFQNTVDKYINEAVKL